MKNKLEVVRYVENVLKKNRITSALAEAEILVGHFTRLDRSHLYIDRQPILPGIRRRIETALKRRIARKPLQVVLGETQFYSHRFVVSKDALIPRPETELLVEETLNVLNRVPTPKAPVDSRYTGSILEIGTGSGCVATSLTLALPDCRMTALDKSQKALNLARKNADIHGVKSRISFIKSDLFSAIKPGTKWDVIVSNPPYIPRKDFKMLAPEVLSEPRLALDGGKTGLEVINKILDQAPYFLNEEGWLLMEIGKGQSKILARDLERKKRFRDFTFVKDYNGIDRVLKAKIG